MRVRQALPIVLASTLWMGPPLVLSAGAPPLQARKPLVAAAKPRVAQAASTPATPASSVSTAQVGAALPAGMAAPPMTLWRFLGVPQGLSRVAGATFNRRGNFPGLEPKPPLKALADPANLLADNKAIKTAAQIKKEEDLAKQKIKALKYLAKIGCGCYPGVKEALMEALEDCTEKVRYEAAKQIGNAAENKCETCSKTCCCDADMIQALWDVANKRDANNCFVEPSERVREAACEALLACRRVVPVYPGPPSGLPPLPPGETVPERGPPGETVPDTIPPGANETRSQQETDALLSEIFGISPQKGRISKGGKLSKVSSHVRSATPASAKSTKPPTDLAASFPSSPRESDRKPGILLSGRVVAVDYKTSTVDLEFPGKRQPTVGSRFSLHHDYALETLHLGEVEVVYLAKQGRAIARPVGKLDLLKVGKGDQVAGRTAGPTAPAESVAVAPEASAPHSATMQSPPPLAAPAKKIIRRRADLTPARAVGLQAEAAASGVRSQASQKEPARAAGLQPSMKASAKANPAPQDSQPPAAVKPVREPAFVLPPLPSVAEVEISTDDDRGVEVPSQAKPAVTVRLVQPRPVKRAAVEKPSVLGLKPENSAVELRQTTASDRSDATDGLPASVTRPEVKTTPLVRPVTRSARGAESEQIQRGKATEIKFAATSVDRKPEAGAAPASWVTIED
ncbi:MAG TPA: hypothetical protein VN699_01685 [Pirellulales bacterium]|nr:hypothetical protein [Pirellulales bacterium]